MNTVYNTYGHKFPAGAAGGRRAGSIAGRRPGRRRGYHRQRAYATAPTRQSERAEKGAKVNPPDLHHRGGEPPRVRDRHQPVVPAGEPGLPRHGGARPGRDHAVPAVQGGGGHHKKKGSTPAKPSDANPSPLLNAWNAAVADQQFWTDEFDLDKRSPTRRTSAAAGRRGARPRLPPGRPGLLPEPDADRRRRVRGLRPDARAPGAGAGAAEAAEHQGPEEDQIEEGEEEAAEDRPRRTRPSTPGTRRSTRRTVTSAASPPGPWAT